MSLLGPRNAQRQAKPHVALGPQAEAQAAVGSGGLGVGRTADRRGDRLFDLLLIAVGG